MPALLNPLSVFSSNFNGLGLLGDKMALGCGRGDPTGVELLDPPPSFSILSSTGFLIGSAVVGGDSRRPGFLLSAG